MFFASWLVVGLLHSPQVPSLHSAQQASARVVAQRPVMSASAVVEAAALKPPRTREDMIQQAAAQPPWGGCARLDHGVKKYVVQGGRASSLPGLPNSRTAIDGESVNDT